MKPTRGRNSVGPDAAEYWSGMAADHVVTRTVRDAAALLDVTSGWSPGDPYGAPEPELPYLEAMRVALGRLRIGFATRGPRGISFDPDCLEAVTRTASWLQALGHHVEEASPDWDAELLGLGVMDVFASDVARAIEDRHAATGIPPSNAVLERNNLWLWERGRRLSAIDLLRAESRLNVASRQFARFFENHDVWLTPTMAKLPPRLGHLYADVEDVETFFDRLWTFNPFNSVYNVSGQPAISLPLHMGKAGLPVGIMIGARVGREDLLFRLAAQLEAAHPWADRHPPVSLWAKPGITA
jgi:Asp-tRNA(Asn)/Glu-tRNA(Gln) amidotransferase A subunit family amidase